MHALRAVVLALAACLAAASVGCAASAGRSDAAAVAERFHAALEQQDGKAACTELAEETRNVLEQQEGTPCEEAVLSLGFPRGGAAARSDVYVTTASVQLAGSEMTVLDEGPQGWKVSAAGCTPTAPNQPYDCALEG